MHNSLKSPVGHSDVYRFSPKDDELLAVVARALARLASSRLPSSDQLRTIDDARKFFSRLPLIQRGANFTIDIIRAPEVVGQFTVVRSWEIDASGGELRLTSGGSISSPQTGGDSFTSFYWEIVPGEEPTWDDYSEKWSVLAKTLTLAREIADLDFEKERLELTIE